MKYAESLLSTGCVPDNGAALGTERTGRGPYYQPVTEAVTPCDLQDGLDLPSACFSSQHCAQGVLESLLQGPVGLEPGITALFCPLVQITQQPH